MRKIRPVACKDYNSQTVSHRNWILCSVACKDYNSQTVSHRNWILCSLVSDFQQRIQKKKKKKKKKEREI